MYKSAHEEFFDFILKSHVGDPRLSVNHEIQPDVPAEKLSKTSIQSNRSEFDENVHASNKSKTKNKKLNSENNSTLLNDIPKTTNELLKELAQTVKEGQTLQKDVEVLKKVVFSQNSRSNKLCITPSPLGATDYNSNELDQPNYSLASNNYLNEQNLGSSGKLEYYIHSIEPSDFNQKIRIQASSVPILRTNNLTPQCNLIDNHSALQQNFKNNLSRILKRLKQTEQVQISIRSLYQHFKLEIIHHIEEEKVILGRLSDEIKLSNSINFRNQTSIREKDAQVLKLNNSINALNIENKDLSEKYNAVVQEKELLQNEMNIRMHELEKENSKLKAFSEKIEKECEQARFELKKTKDKSSEFDKFISQLKNLGVIEKIDDSKYLVNNENRSLNDELVFLKDLIKDKRDREELLHRNISQLSDENDKLNTNYLESKTSLDKKIRENYILQSILENYKVRIASLEEKNFLLQSEINNWKLKVESETGEKKNADNKISQLESELESYKSELSTRSLEFNNSLSRLGQAYFELNETKQLLKDSKHELENIKEKVKLMNRENKELNDALSNQFHLNRKKDIEIETLKKEFESKTSDLEKEILSNSELTKKLAELEANYSRIENERFEIHKELSNRCFVEIEKKESLERITSDYNELKKELKQKDLQISKLRSELKDTINIYEQESLNKINLLETQLNEKFKHEINVIEESKKNISFENKNLLEEVAHQKKMIQELIYEKISLNNEINLLKEAADTNKKQFESSIQILSMELSALQELGNNKIVDYQEAKGVRNLIEHINKLEFEATLPETGDNTHQAELLQIQSTTAPPSNYTVLKTENDYFNFNQTAFPDKIINTSEIEFSDFCQIEASLSAQCEMAYIDIISQTERFKDLSNKLKSLEEILWRNGEKSISEIVIKFFIELDSIGVSSKELLKTINSRSKSKAEIDNELSNKVTDISRAWVLEAEVSKQILDYAHKIRNTAAKERMVWIEKKN